MIRQQKVLDEKSVQSFHGLSLHDTVKQLLLSGDLKSAEKFKNEYKMPDKRYWWLRVEVYSELQQWDDLEKFSKLKKSPIGYEPFAEACLKRNNGNEARKYILRSREDNRADLFMKAR